MSFKRSLRDYLRFNKREGRGALILLFILISLAAINFYVRQQPSEPIVLSEEEQALVDEMKSKVQKVSKEQETDMTSVDQQPVDVLTVFPFDPNTVTQSELVELGLNQSIAQRIINYRSKGGSFNSAADLSKIYGMDSTWLATVMPYVEIESSLVEIRKQEKKPNEKAPIAIVELNSADSMALDQLPGIGPFYCQQILKRRKELGGFVSISQLLDVYRMRKETVENLVGLIEIDNSLVRKINLNVCSTEDLASHPYLTWKQSKIICAFRDQHGGFDSVEDVKRTDVISDSTYKQIEPYLVVK